MTDKPLSFAMANALQAVARMKGDAASDAMDEASDLSHHGQLAPTPADEPQQGWQTVDCEDRANRKPCGRARPSWLKVC